VIIVDTALKKAHSDGKPVRVGMIGAGFMAKGFANQVINSVPGMSLVAISNRTLEKAGKCYTDHGGGDPKSVSRLSQINECIKKGVPAITDDPFLLTRADGIDCLIDITGDVELGSRIAMDAIKHKKHLILMNAEVDGTVGPILHEYAKKAGVILSGSDGDQPGVQVNLFRFVKSIGLTPLLCGNIKGLHDPYRNPTTQKGFAEKWGQNLSMVTSFADGCKISFEQAIVANAVGFKVAKRGMYGYTHDDIVDTATKLYDIDELKRLGGIVDYVVRGRPSPGIFLFATHDDPKQRHYLNLYKLGEGPLYSFYTPWHLCHFEAPLSCARAVLCNDPVFQPVYGPMVDVITAAKIDLKKGQVLDGLGHYMTYGLAENADVTYRDRLLPIGIAEGAKLKRDIPKDDVLTYDDVELPAGKTSIQLRQEQDNFFAHRWNNSAAA
jgi:predicted homoserine dehydrogenase-like protein